MRLTLEIYRSRAGHFSGSVQPEGGQPRVAFSGLLDLVRVLEDLGPEEPPCRTGSPDDPQEAVR